jgi:hypothetical protein
VRRTLYPGAEAQTIIFLIQSDYHHVDWMSSQPIRPSRMLRKYLAHWSAATALLAGTLLHARTLTGQAQQVHPVSHFHLLALPSLGSEAEDRLRLETLNDSADDSGFLLRSYSSGLARALGRSRIAWGALLPEIRTRYNSRLPAGLNDGSLQPGSGWYIQGLGGAFARLGPLTIVLVPELNYEANGRVPTLPDSLGGDSVTVPWYRNRVDLPLRFDARSTTRLLAGQSSLSLSVGPLSGGVSTENQWWGPGLVNALVMSDNAAGFPHLFLRTGRPIDIGLGTLEGRWLVGELTDSRYFLTNDSVGVRSLSGAALVFRPLAVPGLSLGAARVVYGPARDRGEVTGRFAESLTRWWAPDSLAPAAEQPHRAQILSFFGRWAFPADGLEIYAEWARTHLPTSLSEFLQAPGYSQGYTAGFQWFRSLPRAAGLRLESEATFLERSSPRGPTESFYASSEVPGGYTHEGQMVGAAIGPGASSQWLATDYLARTWRAGVFLQRVRWNEDAYLTRTSPWPFLGHDVSVNAGIRASYSLRGVRLEGTISRGQRMNYLFQNWSKSWEAAAKDAVDIWNTRLETRLSYTGVLRAVPPEPVQPAAVTALPEPEHVRAAGPSRDADFTAARTAPDFP